MKLDPKERYVVAYCRLSDRMMTVWWTYLILRLALAGIFAFGFYYVNQAMIFTAFGTLLLLDISSQARQPRFCRLLSSAIEKLEGRIDELEQPQSTTSHPPADKIS